jgi:hypothetical protein
VVVTPLPGRTPADDPFGGGRSAARALLASLAFRVRHAWHGAPDGFAEARPAEGARSAGELVGHLVDLLRFAATAFEVPPADAADRVPARAEHVAGAAGDGSDVGDRAPRPLDAFDSACRDLDRALRDGVPSGGPLDPSAMLRGPLADALTHAGQLTLLRRLADAPVERVSYWRVPMPAPGDDG